MSIINQKLSKVLFLLAFIGATDLLYGCSQSEKNNEAIVLETGETDNQNTDDVRETESSNNDTRPSAAASEEETIQSPIFVHICGQICAPGVYRLNDGDRVVDLVLKAGGLTSEACENYVNQARVLVDGEQVYIPSQKEVQSGEVEITSGQSSQNQDSKTNSLININKATKEELMSLPGIGEAKAASILSYREKVGSFQTVEEIMNIEGIKDGLFNKIKDLITIG